jgi:hypothetical protein
MKQSSRMPTIEREPGRPTWRDLLAAYGRARANWEADPSERALAALFTGAEILARELAKPGRFPLGAVFATAGATEAMVAGLHVPPEFLLPHARGDWGELCAEDRQENERALLRGGRVLSAYRTRQDTRLWVITEWDRGATTLLLPDEY